jgi:hypothetical protein
MTLTTHPHSVPDALIATLPTATPSTTRHVPDDATAPRGPAIDDANTDRLGQSCRTCATGTYAAGPGAGHVTCDGCGHATVRRGVIGTRRNRG